MKYITILFFPVFLSACSTPSAVPPIIRAEAYFLMNMDPVAARQELIHYNECWEVHLDNVRAYLQCEPNRIAEMQHAMRWSGYAAFVHQHAEALVKQDSNRWQLHGLLATKAKHWERVRKRLH